MCIYNTHIHVHVKNKKITNKLVGYKHCLPIHQKSVLNILYIFMRDKATYKRVNDMETVARLLKTTKSNVCLYTSFIISQIEKCNTIICIHHKYIIFIQ